MNRDTVSAALSAVHRFLDCAEAYQNKQSDFGWLGTKESGALRRASMDLTRALADLRRPG